MKNKVFSLSSSSSSSRCSFLFFSFFFLSNPLYLLMIPFILRHCFTQSFDTF